MAYPQDLNRLLGSRSALEKLLASNRFIDDLNSSLSAMTAFNDRLQRLAFPTNGLMQVSQQLASMAPRMALLQDAQKLQFTGLTQAAVEAARFAEFNSTLMSTIERINSSFVVPDAARLVRLLPDLGQITAWVEDFEEGREVFVEAGFTVPGYLPMRFVTGAASIPEQVRPAVATNILLAVSRKPEFEASLLETLGSSAILSSRSGVLEVALSAHRSGNYLLSIPALLAQAEGMFADALVLRNAVRSSRGKLYAADTAGKFKLDRKGRRIPIKGSDDLRRQAQIIGDDLLDETSAQWSNGLTKHRNAILHGRRPRYRSPKTSVQALLMCHALAAAIAEFESPTKT